MSLSQLSIDIWNLQNNFKSKFDDINTKMETIQKNQTLLLAEIKTMKTLIKSIETDNLFDYSGNYHKDNHKDNHKDCYKEITNDSIWIIALKILSILF